MPLLIFCQDKNYPTVQRLWLARVNTLLNIPLDTQKSVLTTSLCSDLSWVWHSIKQTVRDVRYKLWFSSNLIQNFLKLPWPLLVGYGHPNFMFWHAKARQRIIAPFLSLTCDNVNWQWRDSPHLRRIKSYRTPKLTHMNSSPSTYQKIAVRNGRKKFHERFQRFF